MFKIVHPRCQAPFDFGGRSINYKSYKSSASLFQLHTRKFGSHIDGLYTSRRLLDDQAELFDHCLAHQELLRLARYGHREVVDESYVFRRFVMSDRGAAESDDVLFR